MEIFGEIEIDDKNIFRIYMDKYNDKDYLHIRKATWNESIKRYSFTKEGVFLKKEQLPQFLEAVNNLIIYLKKERKNELMLLLQNATGK